MSGLCLILATATLPLAGTTFSLEWTHSVERIRWHEDWALTPDGLRLTGAAVQGSGAGMEAGPGARLIDGWWRWTPDLPPQPALHLAASGATPSGWTLCDAATCRDIGTAPGTPITLAPCVP